jgi:orotidine 5'-phosphate decarboxylase subfamily 2
MNFREKLSGIIHENNSLLCIGLDIDKEKMPKFLFESSENPFFEFNKSIIDSTKDLVCAYKLNMAFYEVLGAKCFDVIKKTLQHIPDNIVTIIDGKRNDIGNTAQKYAESIFEILRSDSTTINPYLGKNGITPFLKYKDKCSFILCRTSNPSAIDFQDLHVSTIPLYQLVANKIKEWNYNNNCGAVVGATYPKELKIIRNILGDEVPILLPGIGKQGGDVKKTINYGVNKKGEMALINSSRGIIFTGNDEDFAEISRDRAVSLMKEINKYR